ncbi:putative inner membrane transporter YedA [Burkholderiales bacterium]|nr:putative inner membrane transporter YedA [Burkholderiales bacterium]
MAAFPALFVLLWSTGFVAAKLGLPDAPPFRFLFVRFACVAALMAAVALATGARWPSRREAFHSGVVALMVHGMYLGGVFHAIDGGMPAGTIAMLVGLQPIVTVLIARGWLGETVVARQWVGLAMGLAGVALVVRHKLGLADDLSGFVPAAIALAGISLGTLYQKRHGGGVDLRTGAVVQFAVCAAAYLPLALLVDTEAIRWTPEFAFALAWSVLVLSVGAISLLYVLLRHGAAANVAALFYLVPPVTAWMAWVLFGETLDTLAIAGMALIAVGVALARAPAPAQPE